jgi:hypothetical protein
MPNASYLKEHFFKEGRILEQHALWILEAVTRILKREPNMVLVSSPMTGTFFYCLCWDARMWWLIDFIVVARF